MLLLLLLLLLLLPLLGRNRSLVNLQIFNDADGIYTFTYEQERNENCLVCSNVPQSLEFPPDAKLTDLIEFLTTSAKYQMKSPGITTTYSDGKNRTLYMQSKSQAVNLVLLIVRGNKRRLAVSSIEERTRPNLKKSLKELQLIDGQQLIVADVTSPTSLTFKLKLKDN